jgi:hypothetical protein
MKAKFIIYTILWSVFFILYVLAFCQPTTNY